MDLSNTVCNVRFAVRVFRLVSQIIFLHLLKKNAQTYSSASALNHSTFSNYSIQL